MNLSVAEIATNGRVPNVVIIGTGQLGSRYLQGLVGSATPLRVWAVDPSEQSRGLAQQRWEQAGGAKAPHKLHLSTDVLPLPRVLDLVLITTNANVREEVIKSLAYRASVRYWVLEKILAQSEYSLDAILELTSGARGRWVNTPRRMMVWHQELHELLRNTQPMTLRVGNNLWGLGCNAIHFLDLAAWWSASDLLSVDCSNLDSSWVASKRPGFFEVTGRLEANYANGSRCVLESSRAGKSFGISIETPLGLWKINEGEGIAIDPEGRSHVGRMEFQSEMTTRLVDSILAKGRCDLPTLEASVSIHRPFLRAMLHQWNQSGSRSDLFVPVT